MRNLIQYPILINHDMAYLYSEIKPINKPSGMGQLYFYIHNINKTFCQVVPYLFTPACHLNPMH